MRARIEAGGRIVEIECGEAGTSYRELADKALEVWSGTEGASKGQGPAYGFVSAERSRDRDPSSAIRRHPGVPE